MFLNKIRFRWCGIVLSAVVCCFLPGVAMAQEEPAKIEDLNLKNQMESDAAGVDEPQGTSDKDLAEANNPLANFTALSLHNYYIGELTKPDDEYANQVWLRFAKPFKIGGTSWIMRASLPLNTYPVPPSLDHETGLGDLNVFATYVIDVGNPAISLGVGPQLTLPTATDDALGSEKWSAGLVNTAFVAISPKLQYGYLLSWQQSFAGEDDRADVNIGGFQPFLFYQLGSGFYLRSSAVMSLNMENGDYTVPIGLGIGKVFRSKIAIHNFFIEPQVSVADEGPGWPEWQIFIGFNNQF